MDGKVSIDWIILAGGKSERLKPAFDGPKALLPVAGKTLIERQIERALPYAKRIILSLGYRGEEVKNFVREKYPDKNIICLIEPEPLGTGGALKYVLDNINVSKFFFVVNCDDLSDVNVVDVYLIEDDVLCLGNFRCPYGVVVTHGNRIVSFRQKPILKDIWVSIGFYKLYKNSVYPLLKEKCSLEDDVFPKMDLYGYKHRGYWFTVNDKKQLDEVERFYENKCNGSG